MTPDEAQQLLAACAAFDNRQPSQIAKRAWATALKDMPLDQDGFDAVARFYGTPPKEAGQRLWIQPHDVRTWRQIIRRERLENFQYEADPDETPRQYLARRRAQLNAVAGGLVPAPSAVPALEGGPHPDIALILTDIGRTVPGEESETDEAATVRRPGPLGLECPKCSAAIGRPCRTPSGRERSTHPARNTVATGGQLADPEAERLEMERRRQVSARHLERRVGEDDLETEAS